MNQVYLTDSFLLPFANGMLSKCNCAYFHLIYFLHFCIFHRHVFISFTREIEFMKKEEDHSKLLEERDQKYAEQLKIYQEKVKQYYILK